MNSLNNLYNKLNMLQRLQSMIFFFKNSLILIVFSLFLNVHFIYELFN